VNGAGPDRPGEPVDGRRVAGILLRAGAVPALAADLVVIMAALPSATEAVTGAVVGTLLTVTAFGIGPVLLRYARNVEPTMLLALAVAAYLTVVSALGVAYALLSDVVWLESFWVGIAILAGSLAWLAGQAWATSRLRVLTFGDRVSPG
jgi:ATP synthase protein I